MRAGHALMRQWPKLTVLQVRQARVNNWRFIIASSNLGRKGHPLLKICMLFYMLYQQEPSQKQLCQITVKTKSSKMIPGGKLFHPVGGLENSFSEHFDSRTLLHYLHSSIHLSFIHIYHFDMLSLAVWQDTCHACKNTRYLEGHGFDPRQGLKKFVFRVFRLKNASPLLTFYPSHQSIYHLFTFMIFTCSALQYGRTHVTHIRIAPHESPIAQCLDRYL